MPARLSASWAAFAIEEVNGFCNELTMIQTVLPFSAETSIRWLGPWNGGTFIARATCACARATPGGVDWLASGCVAAPELRATPATAAAPANRTTSAVLVRMRGFARMDRLLGRWARL